MFLISRRKSILSKVELQAEIFQLLQVYSPIDLNYAHHQNKVDAIKKLRYILAHCNRNELLETDIEHLILCALTVVYYFGMRIKLSQLRSKYWYLCGNPLFRKAERAFQKTMDMLLPEQSETTIKIILTFFTEVSLWHLEHLVVQVLDVLLYFDKGNITLFNTMLTDIHCVLFDDINSARHRIRVFYVLLKSKNWMIDKNKLLPFVTRLLQVFAYSMSKDDENKSAYNYLKRGFYVCLCRIFERVENHHRLMIITTMLDWFSVVNIVSQEDVLQFSTLLDHAAECYVVKLYAHSFAEGLIEHVLENLVGSSSGTRSLVGCKLLQKFLDRQKNGRYLLVPKIFYVFTKGGIKIGVYNSSDKAFIRQYRETFHQFLMKAMTNHCTNLVNLKIIFCIICCTVLEVPCGLTAAAAACFVMNVQDFALHGEDMPPACRCWLHALVISVMSLICWVHKAPVLYTYVSTMIARRAKEAPQLNPPIKYYYNTANHVTWNKPTLFFEDWELRYGLWKHFQATTRSVPVNDDINSKKMATLDLGN